MREAAISVEAVSKRFGRGARAVDALREVTLRVAPGEIYGLLGRNGAGKTTLVKILLDIVRADAGDTRLGGRPTRLPAARRGVGYLPEDHRFPEYQTGEGVLRFYAGLSGRRLGGKGRGRSIDELLGLVDLVAARKKKIRAYSKGMKQRLGLAQALLADPEILFLDEPTDGVDPVGRAQVRDLLLQLKGEGKTIFLNSHMLSEIERVCDRVGILRDGRLVEEGTLEALTSTDLVYSIRTDPPPDGALVEALRPQVVSLARTESGFDVGVKADADIDLLVDFLRARKFGIRALVGKKLSLEDVFLAAVSGPEAGKGGEA
jgi:ABC-2 type transport system ATP-binding protein